MTKDKLPQTGSRAVQEFLSKTKDIAPIQASGNSSRLLFAMDATASREHTWDIACKIQADMFMSTQTMGSLEISLCYYRGYEEFHYFGWTKNAARLRDQMLQVRCLGGQTQIKRTLDHALSICSEQKVKAVVFVGDCCEEPVDLIAASAGKLGMLGVPIFVFHEGHDPSARTAFKHIAELSKGAYCPFDQNSAQQLKDLLCAVAAYVVGGLNALQNQTKQGNSIAAEMIKQLPKSS